MALTPGSFSQMVWGGGQVTPATSQSPPAATQTVQAGAATGMLSAPAAGQPNVKWQGKMPIIGLDNVLYDPNSFTDAWNPIDRKSVDGNVHNIYSHPADSLGMFSWQHSGDPSKAVLVPQTFTYNGKEYKYTDQPYNSQGDPYGDVDQSFLSYLNFNPSKHGSWLLSDIDDVKTSLGFNLPVSPKLKGEEDGGGVGTWDFMGDVLRKRHQETETPFGTFNVGQVGRGPGMWKGFWEGFSPALAVMMPAIIGGWSAASASGGSGVSASAASSTAGSLGEGAVGSGITAGGSLGSGVGANLSNLGTVSGSTAGGIGTGALGNGVTVGTNLGAGVGASLGSLASAAIPGAVDTSLPGMLRTQLSPGNLGQSALKNAVQQAATTGSVDPRKIAAGVATGAISNAAGAATAWAADSPGASIVGSSLTNAAVKGMLASAANGNTNNAGSSTAATGNSTQPIRNFSPGTFGSIVWRS